MMKFLKNSRKSFETVEYGIELKFPQFYDLVYKQENKETVAYINTANAFDIETTTLNEECAFMYHFQYCINGSVYFGRLWEEFQYFMKSVVDFYDLSFYKRLVIYVHNLSYEWQFMKNFIKVKTIFARGKRKIVKILTEDGIEFRCSYFLSNMSLEKFYENTAGCTVKKLKEVFDYKKLRTPFYKMTDTENEYCFNDVYGLYQCIHEKIIVFGNITKIPLTSTGIVRNECRNAMRKNKLNRDIFLKNALNKEIYLILKEVFRGGDTHANRKYAGLIMSNVKSYDIASSYPFVMAHEYFPFGRFKKVSLKNKDEFYKYLKEKCCLFKISIYDLTSDEKNAVPYIPISKCLKTSKVVNDNGRVLQADFVQMYMTELDFECARLSYGKFQYSIDEFYYCERGYLPKELIEVLFENYRKKTELKGLPEFEYEYAKSKNIVNAMFGMLVTSIDNDEYVLGDDLLLKEEKCDVEEALDKYYNSRNNFLSYQWGVWVTAQARYRLRQAIHEIGSDLIYVDTDSVKFINYEAHEDFFNKINKEVYEWCEKNDRVYYNKKKEPSYIGAWDDEGIYQRFKTLGAKKYCVEKHGKFQITVSGMAKEKGAAAVGSFENFEIGRTFTDIGRMTFYYNERTPHKITVDGHTFTNASNAAAIDTTYTLGITDEYYDLIEKNLK